MCWCNLGSRVDHAKLPLVNEVLNSLGIFYSLLLTKGYHLINHLFYNVFYVGILLEV